MKADIGISDEHKRKVSLMLNTLLADEFVLYTKTKKYHWNMQTMEFIALHEFFDTLAEELLEIIDEIAERNRHIGEFSIGSLDAFLKVTNLVEDESDSNIEQMITNLVKDHETIIRYARRHMDEVNDIFKDAGTADYMLKWIEAHEKTAWMLRSHLK
ncbi:Dps family protein [Aureibacter tunicatorum]|uniref:Starvation-inducible DNA-binding protein n=1 Tax=Aureibacter tunicatorum TaxID=866807 RepID=A0AAE3XQX5_9BACT|nr:Dps family protein [Aureibacter tunicatorum]MDR6239779.1 starvation-inducible DNA-binding protein [Aureibacter tunicatorum]BDD04254.1 DNA starvation/stationary phase protection protein [Aureibacter tunicatorum]